MPVYPTIASQFNDEGVNRLFKALVDKICDRYDLKWETHLFTKTEPAEDIHTQAIIPGQRQRYLSEVSEAVRDYHAWAEQQVEVAAKLDQVEGTLQQLDRWNPGKQEALLETLAEMQEHWLSKLDAHCQK